MQRRQYVISNVWESEKIVRDFLFKKARNVRFIGKEEFVLDLFAKKKRYGGAEDPHFQKVLKHLEDNLLEKETKANKLFFWNIEEEYYYYKLSPQMKYLFNRTTLLYEPLTNEFYKKKKHFFYGLEDPLFYTKDEQLGLVINHEQMIILYLTAAEKEMLETKGVELEFFSR